MYPNPQLTRLASRRHVLRLQIHRRRDNCAEAAAIVTRPLRLLDQLIALWRDFAPFATAVGARRGPMAGENTSRPQNSLRTVALTLVRSILGQS